MKPVRLFTVRHGETESARERRFTGSRDVPLNPHGVRQSEAVARALAGAFVGAVYASPLARAQASAAPVAAAHQVAVRVAPAFREMYFGDWEGLTRAEVAVRDPERFAVWRVTPHLAEPPGGERLPDVAGRVAAALQALLEEHAGQTVVLVTHAIVTRLIVLAALGLGADRLWSVDASPAGITEIEYQDGWVTVHRMNTLTHLDGLDEGAP
ncbi:MAG TPA: histidine phosphatase family protein [Methylomirabilota bacterium]|nr:histidine phosphatase family protein [Methylomirabilota bacterium]